MATAGTSIIPPTKILLSNFILEFLRDCFALSISIFVCLSSWSEESIGIRILILPNSDALRIAFN